MKVKESISVMWFRRDLRIEDNAALYHALQSSNPVLCLFIFDTEILNDLEDKSDARVTFIYDQIQHLNHQLQAAGSGLKVAYGNVKEVFTNLFNEYSVTEIFTNRDYEPYAIQRDQIIKSIAEAHGSIFKDYKDQVIFEKDEIVSNSGPYKVYTAYKNKWKDKLSESDLKPYPSQKSLSNLYKSSFKLFQLKDLGFFRSSIPLPSKNISGKDIAQYDKVRDIPSLDATTHLGIHLRFGTVSIRAMVKLAKQYNDTWLNELIWREFFMQLLYHFPQVVREPFNKKFKNLQWRYDEADFSKWKEGKTGYPLVDAGMRELNQTGFMHNRVRMVTASFLTKHLLIDWKWGEAYFAQKLLDFELSSNNGNWQWCAGTGADAQPFFRIFNPTLQQERFDPEFKYIKKWVPEFGTPAYPKPMVDHKLAVQRAKEAFNVIKRVV